MSDGGVDDPVLLGEDVVVRVAEANRDEPGDEPGEGQHDRELRHGMSASALFGG